MSGGCKKKIKIPKHQNKVAFKIVFDQRAIDHQKKVSLNKYIFYIMNFLVYVNVVHNKCNGNYNITNIKRLLKQVNVTFVLIKTCSEVI
jgi:hypothetical protein